MQTGDIVRDDQGRSLQVGQLLGRGLWGRTYAARDEASGLSVVIKVPHRASDLPDSTGALSAASLAAACSEIALELGRLYEHGGCPALPGLHGRLALDDGTPALVMPKAASLEQRLATGTSLEDVLRTLLAATHQLKAFGEVQGFHGNLKPTNLLLADSGEVWLSDPVTPAFRKVYGELLRASRGAAAQQWVAPEIRESTGDLPFGIPGDTYSLSMVLFRAGMISPGHERYSDTPMEGLTKAGLVSLKDRVLNRLKAEHSNPRFHTRLADRLCALLNRALSRQLSPSPPYRFRRLDEFGQRLSEVHAMVHPAVTHVGRLILDHRAGQDGFVTDEEVRFSASVACSPGVESHEEVACGLAVFDLDHETRLRVEECSYAVDRHPSGRFRFSFRIGELRPGGYRVRIAFTIRDSGDEPVTAEGEFRVRPAPGYIPPVSEPISAPIPLRAEGPDDDEVRRTEPGVASPAASAAEPPASVPSGPATARVQPVQRPAQVRAVAEAVADPASADLPLPTPIAPIAPFEPPRRPTRRTRADHARVSLVGAEEVADDPSTPAEDRLLLRPDARQGWRSAPVHRGGRTTDAGVPVSRVSGPSPAPAASTGTRAQGGTPSVERGLEPAHSAVTTPPSTFGGRPTTPPALFGGAAPSGLGRAEPQVGPLSSAPPTSPMAALPTAGAVALKVRPELEPEGRATEPAHRPTEPMDRSLPPQPPAAFTSLGRWSELPLPQTQGTEFGLPSVDSATEVTFDPATDDAFGQQGPVGTLLTQLIETVRSDLYIMIIGSMALACAGLAFLLMVLKT